MYHPVWLRHDAQLVEFPTHGEVQVLVPSLDSAGITATIAFCGFTNAFTWVCIKIILLFGLICNDTPVNWPSHPILVSLTNSTRKLIPRNCVIQMQIYKLYQFPSIQQDGFPEAKIPAKLLELGPS